MARTPPPIAVTVPVLAGMLLLLGTTAALGQAPGTTTGATSGMILAGPALHPRSDAPAQEGPLLGNEPETNPVVKPRGRIEADAIFVDQSPRNRATVGNVQNAVGFRRARLGAEGTVGEQTRWVSEFDFVGGQIAFRDVYLAVTELPLVREVQVGHFREPFSLEGAESSNYFSFTERSPANSLDPARNWGVALFSHLENERATFAVGAFRSGTDSTGTDLGDGNDMAYTVRLTALPWYDAASSDPYLMHVGAAFSQRQAKNDVVTFSQAPQSNLLQSTDNPLTPFARNITVPANQNQLYNLQWAVVAGPLSLQAEWSATYIDQIGGDPVLLQGAYAFASWFLTGEHREYVPSRGAFGQTRVRSPFALTRGNQTLARGPGAWELTARFAYLDFADDNLPVQNGLPVGDRVSVTTLGVNWYLNDHVRILFNFDHAVPVAPTFGPSSANAFTIRSAIFW